MTYNSTRSDKPKKRAPALLIFGFSLIFVSTSLCSSTYITRSQTPDSTSQAPPALFLPLVIDGQGPAPDATPTPTLPPWVTPSPTLPPWVTPTPTLPPWVTPTATLPPGVTPTPTPTSPPTTPPPPQEGEEWSQHAHDAQRTSYTDQVVPSPWRWKWAWNGPDAFGGVSPGKTSLPRNVQPVTGAGRVYIAAGNRGVYALNNANGAQLWNAVNLGTVNSTVAYDADTQAVFVVSTNGNLYKLDAASGAILDQFSGGGSSSLPLPPAVISDRVFFSMGSFVYAVDKASMEQIWAYNAGDTVETPPAYSVSRDRVVAVSSDLYVHAINNSDGSRAWRVKPTVREGGDPGGDNTDLAQARNGWPVIAERHGLALIKYRLDWQTMWNWSPWPTSNSQIRANLQNQPDQQALFALDLDDGSVPFIANLGHGGYGDGNYMPMGPQPAVKPLPDGGEVVWTVIRGGGYDGRSDSHMGEMLLDSSTIPGLEAGYVRWMEDIFTNGSGYFPTDEQPYVSVAGDYFFSGHWEAGAAFQVTDRSPTYGAYNNPIQTEVAYAVASSQDEPSCPFSPSHYCPDGLFNTRSYPPGFYIYYNQGNIYDQYWSEYAAWVVSNNTVYFRSCDGAIVALENGEPLAQSQMSNLLLVNSQPDDRIQTSDISTSLADNRDSDQVISAEEARQHAGEYRTVEFTVRHVINSGNKIIATMENPHQGYFKAIILEKDWAKFGSALESIFPLNQVIRVRGQITWYQGDPVIYLIQPSEIRILSRTGDLTKE